MSGKHLRYSLLLVILALLVGAFSVAQAQDKVPIVWYIGLGTGTNPEQQDAQNKVVADFNASHPNIELSLSVAANNDVAYDTLATLIASGKGPDIVGPVGFSGANGFPGSWLDLKPLIDKTGFDMSIFPKSLVDLYISPEGQIGIPFAVYPSFIYYNRDLFDEAGLNYPPHEFGAKYEMPDGTMVDWNFDTVAQIAKILTVDANGNDATSADFDPSKIVQFGFNFDSKQMRNIFSSFGGADFWNTDTKTVTMPENWRAMAHWYWDGIWKEHFIPSTSYRLSELLGKDNEFGSGHVGMALTHLWYTCCIQKTVGMFKWDIGTVPSYMGKYYSPTDADTFRILKASQHPDEAFTVLSYLLTDAVPILAPTYGAYPAHPAYQQPYIDGLNVIYPMNVDWKVAVESLNYTATPNHEADFPNFQKGFDRFQAFQTLMEGDTGEKMDVDAEYDKLGTDLQAILTESK